MKKLIQLTSIILVALILVTSSKIFNYSATATNNITVFEAESTQGIAESREVKADRILCDINRHTVNYPLFTAGMTIPAGHYRVLVFANLLEEPLDSSNYILRFDIYGNKGAGMEVIYPAYVIRSQFQELNKFQPVMVEFTTPVELTTAQLRFQFNKNASIEIDKFALLNDSNYFVNIEAETLGTQLPAGSVKANQGILAQKGVVGQCLATWGWYGNIPAGQKKAVIHMKLIEGTGNPSNVFTHFTLAASTATTARSERFGTGINEGMFPVLNQYYAIEIPINAAEDLISAEPYLWHALGGTATCTYMIDRIEFTEADFNTNAAKVSGITYEAESSLAQANTRSITTDGQAVDCNPSANDAGFFVFGSDYSLTPGTYKITAVMKVKERTLDPNTKFASIDTYYKIGGVDEVSNVSVIRDVQFASLDTWTNISLYFKTTSTLTNLQIRMQSYDKIHFQVDKFIIESVDTTTPIIVEAENVDGSSTGTFTNEGIRCVVGNATDFATFGSKLALDEGKYNVTIYAKQLTAAAKTTDSIFSFSLSYVQGVSAKTGFNKTFIQSDFTQVNEYKAFVVPIEVPRGARFTETQLITRFEGKAGIVIDKFEVLYTGPAGDPVPQPFFAVEAETMGSNIGVNVGSGIVCAKGMGVNYALFGTNIEIPAGKYRAVIYMKVIQKSGSDNTVVSMFDLFCNPDGGARTQMYDTNITEESFPIADKYYPVVIPFETLVPLKSTEMRVYFTDQVTVKYDKLMILKEGDVLPAAVQEVVVPPKRPDGTPVYENYTVPLTAENIQFSTAASGKIANGRIEFRKEEHTRGDMKGLAEKVYLTNGDKIARIYFRSPVSISGTYKFLKVTVLQNLMPISSLTYTAGDFSTYNNKSFIVDIPFVADENMPMDIMVNWLGNYDMIIDKIVFKSDDAPDNTTYKFNMTTLLNKSMVSITAEDIVGMNAIDVLEISSAKGIKILLPASNVQEWLDSYLSVDIMLNEANGVRIPNLNNLANSYDAVVRKLNAFDLSIVFHSTTGEIKLDKLPAFLQIQLPISSTVTAGKNLEYLESLIYVMPENGKVSLLAGRIASDRKSISFSSKQMGTYYVGLADLSSIITPDDVIVSSGTSPNTGETQELYLILLICLSLAFLSTLIILKRISAKQ